MNTPASLHVRPAIRCLALALAAGLALAPAPAFSQDQEPVYDWTDHADAAPDFDAWNPDIQEAPYFETWDFWMWADDGTFIMVQFLTSSFGFGIERNASGRMIVVEPTGRNVDGAGDGVWFGDRGWEWDEGDWSWTEEPLDISFRDCHIRGDGRVFELYMRGRQHTTYLDVTLELQEEIFTPGDGRVAYGWDQHRFYAQQVLPRFTFSGQLSRRADDDVEHDWQPIAGLGYGEHTLTNDYPFEVMSELQGFRALRRDGLSIVFDGMTTPRDYGGRNIGWARVALDGVQLFESHEVTFTPSDVRPYSASGTDYNVPYGYEFQASNGTDWVHVVVHDAELVSSESPFARIGSFLRAMLGAMMAPYDFEFAVDYDAWVHVGGHTAYVAGRGWSTMNFTR